MSRGAYQPVRVWDATVRLTHWWNAFLILLLLPLGTILYLRDVLKIPKDTVSTIIDIHAFVGFGLAAGLIIRITYLFAGAMSASWRDILPHTRAQFDLAVRTIRYYLSGCKGECPLYYAHNPLAGMAYTGFFVFAAVQVVTGSIMYLLGDGTPVAYGHEGHMSAPPDTWPPKALILVHDISALIVALFIAAHLAALALHDLVEKRGLASSMISGDKFFSSKEMAALGIHSEGEDEA